jgi:hypothetical protein
MNRRSFLNLTPAFPAAAVTASLTLREEGKPAIDGLDVSVLKLQPGDTIVLRTDSNMPFETMERLKANVEYLFPDVKVMVLMDGLTVDGVLRQS